MKNENFKKRLALALVPILSLTAVIGNVPILPTSVFAVTQDEVYIEEPVGIEEEDLEVEETAEETTTLEVEEPAAIEEETEEVEEPAAVEEDVLDVEEPEALLDEVPEELQNLSVVNKDALNAASAWTITNKKLTSKVEYKVGAEGSFTDVPATTSGGLDFTTIGDTDGVTFKITTDRVQTLKTFTYKVGEADPEPITLTNGEATIANATAKTITAINVEFEDKTTYAISWTGVTGGALTVDGESSPYAYIKDDPAPEVVFTPDEGKVLTEFTVAGANKLGNVVYTEDKISYTFEAKPTKAVAITAKFETIVCSVGDVDFASLTAAIAYINANGSAATDYTIDILDNIPSLALTLPSATKAKSITLKTAKDNEGTPVSVDVAISNPTLAIPTALILDNVVLKATAVNLTLSATASALTVKAGGGIDKVVNVTTAADKVITLEDTTKFAITGNLSGKPNITINDDLEIAGSVAIGDLTYAAAATVDLKKAEAAASSIGKIVVGNFATVLKSSKLSLTIGDIDASAAAADKGLSIKAIELGSKKYPVFKITGEVKKGTDPVSLTLYTDNKYDTAATIDPTTAIITSVKTTKPAAAGDTTGAMFKTLNKNGEASYSFYKDGTSLKLGNTFVEVLDGATSKENFIRLQDALDYINTNKAALATTVIKVSGDIPSHGILTFPEEDITIQSSDNTKQYKVLFTGAVKLNGNLTLTDIELSNGNIKGIAFDLNGKNLTLGTDSKVIFNTVKDTKLPEGTNPKPSKLTVTDSGDLTFLGAITSIGTVDIDDNTIFKGAVANVAEIDIAADKYAYFRGGAITNTLKYGEGSIINLPVNAKGGVTKNITIKDTTTGAITCTGTGKLEVNAVKDKLVPAVAATSTTPAVPEKITIETSAGASEKVNPGAVIVKLVKNSKVLASSFETESKNNKLETAQTLIATKAGTAIKIAAPKLTATAPEITGAGAKPAFSENFVTIEEALAVVGKDAAERDYTLTITDNIVGADLTNIPLNVAVITAAKPAEGKLPFKIVTAKDIGLNGWLTIENLNILAAAKTIGTVITTGTGENPTTSYKNAHDELVLANASLTVSEAYLDGLTLTGLDENEKLVGSSNVTFKKTGYIGYLMLESGTTAGKIGSIPEESKLPVGP